ncbi:MAG: GNAT family N-acetyltransferase [Cyclobacteriaceae bacterium]
MEIKIRPAKETDFAEIVELFKEFSSFEKQSEKMTNSVDRMQQEKDFFHCFVAEINSKIIGYVSYFFLLLYLDRQVSAYG